MILERQQTLMLLKEMTGRREGIMAVQNSTALRRKDFTHHRS